MILGIVAQVYKPKMFRKKAGNVENVIVSKANYKVERSLFDIIKHTKEQLDNPLWIVVDEESELIPKLKENSLVIVPKHYRRDLIAKGRAINYFIEQKVQPGKWYVFTDDDNLILDDRWLYEIPYYEEKGYVAMNPVLVPRLGKSRLTYAMDFIRYFDDLMVFRFFTGFLKRPLLGLHGELLAVKGEVLKEIGYGNHSFTEDFRFASELVKRGYKVWQSGSRVSIQSPGSLGDLIRQRGRWFKGISKDWMQCPPLMKLMVGLRLLIWVFGVFGSWILSPLWFLFWGTFYPAIPAGLYYWTVYLYGVVKSRRPYLFFLIPFFGIFEAASCWVGLRQKEFVVIEKEELQVSPTRSEVRAWNTSSFLPFLVLVLALLYFGLVLMLLLPLVLGGWSYYP